ncbi:MAG: polysaccharide biosynthesis tyrosine autokinase [Desulfurivibrionaceae bacterium]
MAEQNINTTPAPADDEIDLGQMVAILLNSKWLVAAITLLAVIGALIYIFLAAPIYRGDTLIQVETKGGGITGLDALSGLMNTASEAATEIEIIKSRSVIGAAVDELQLNLLAEPAYFPLLGRPLARRLTGDPEEKPRRALFGLDSFAWGGEEILVQRLVVPKSWEGEPLALVAGKEGEFTLYSPENTAVLTGQVGVTAASGDQGVEIFVAALTARPETGFLVSLLPRGSVIGALQENLRVAEQGKQTGIIEISLESPEPEKLTRILQSIATSYLRQDIEKRSAEAEKTLEFLNRQLPSLKADLDAAETRLKAYKSEKGSIDLSLETQSILEANAEVEKQLSELKLQQATLAEKFTASHPAMVTLRQQQQQLEAKLDELNGQIREMPVEILEAVRLQRDVKVANELYILLLNKAQEMKVVKAGTTGNVRIIDPPVLPGRAAKPNKKMVLVLGFLLGLMGGIAAVFIRQSFRTGVEDPNQVEAALGLPVYATISHSKKQEELEALARKNKKVSGNSSLLALVDKDDIALESLRSLRTSLQFAMLDAPNNIVSFGGPAPGIGKSFVSANLAAILADGGKRILLIDGDMRKGHLHEYFGMTRTGGLSGLISGEVLQDNAIHRTSHEHLDLIPCGIIPPNPSELLMNERFQKILHDLGEGYDLVIIDTPPILAVTDATIIARLCGLNFIILKAGQHPMAEIQQALKRYTQNNIHPNGFIFNDIPVQQSGYGYRYNYQYSYK